MPTINAAMAAIHAAMPGSFPPARASHCDCQASEQAGITGKSNKNRAKILNILKILPLSPFFYITLRLFKTLWPSRLELSQVGNNKLIPR